ncbi:MAG TPA: PDZ domain-containing protein [Vicinamibacteria bacterium]|nr:PDZ domain-containing protein [Vicinamibacteria bacterium]
MTVRTPFSCVLGALVLCGGLLAPFAWAQEPPPPDVKKAPARPKAKGGGPGTVTPSGQAGGGGGGGQQAAPLLLLSPEFACTFAIDGETVPPPLKAQELRRVNALPGQHLLSCVGQNGALKWQKTVEAKPGQQVVEIKMSEVAMASGEDFDRAAAGVWVGISDVRTSGEYVASIVSRSWGFHDAGLSTALHTAGEYLKQKLADLKRFTPSNPARRKLVDDSLRVGGIAAQYVDLMTKAISEAQKANSWLGDPQDMFAQARALEPSIVFPADGLSELKQSKPFQDAVPLDRHAELGLPGDKRDFQLGAKTYAGMPDVLAVVTKNGLADKMGFKNGDRVISVNGQTVPTVWDFKLALRQNAGKGVKVLVEREGKQQEKDVKVPSPL